MKTILQIKGMHCLSCKILIEEVVREMKGVLSCNADYKVGRVEIEHEIEIGTEKLKKELKTLNNYSVTSFKTIP